MSARDKGKQNRKESESIHCAPIPIDLLERYNNYAIIDGKGLLNTGGDTRRHKETWNQSLNVTSTESISGLIDGDYNTINDAFQSHQDDKPRKVQGRRHFLFFFVALYV